jgi:hypothetical protein
MNKTHWQFVMFVALTAMFMGLGVSLWGIKEHNLPITITGLATIAVVCISWWFWVMFIIRTMMNLNESTCGRLVEIKQGLNEALVLIQEYKQFDAK